MGPRRPSGSGAYMAKVQRRGLQAADDSHLLPVREMEATEHWIEAKDGGRSFAKIAQTKADLDAIQCSETDR